MNPQDGKHASRLADEQERFDIWFVRGKLGPPPRNVLKHRLQVIAWALGNREKMLRAIGLLCEEYAHTYDDGRQELLESLYGAFVHRAGEETASRFFATLASKRYNRERREKRIVFEYETLSDSHLKTSKAEFIRQVIETNSLLPRERRMGSQSKIPGAVASNVNKILKKSGAAGKVSSKSKKAGKPRRR
jgi:hypothetical protein